LKVTRLGVRADTEPPEAGGSIADQIEAPEFSLGRDQ